MGCIVVSSVVVLAGIALAFRIGTSAVERGTTGTTTELPRTTTTVRSTATVTADPTTQLFDGGLTVLKSRDFPAGSQVQIAQCLSSQTLKAGLGRLCNARKLQTFRVDASGRFEVTLSLNIRFEAENGKAIDCAATDAYCSASIVSLTDPDIWVQVPLVFDPSDPRREIGLPD